MPRIDDDILESVIYLYPSRSAAIEGERFGGSGFLVGISFPDRPFWWHIYAVTNAHVITRAKATVIRLNTIEGERDVLETSRDTWVCHPDGDDVAVCPIAPRPTHRFKFIPLDRFITRDIIDKHNIGPGDEAFMIGRFVNHEGRQRNTPTVRFGNLSMMDVEPIANDDGLKLDSFLVEVRSLSGYSGSPVFVIVPAFSYRARSDLQVYKAEQFGPWLLGIDWGHLRWFEKVLDKDEKTPIAEQYAVATNSGMAAVAPAWKLAELLNLEQLVMGRLAEEKEVRDSQHE